MRKAYYGVSFLGNVSDKQVFSFPRKGPFLPLNVISDTESPQYLIPIYFLGFLAPEERGVCVCGSLQLIRGLQSPKKEQEEEW